MGKLGGLVLIAALALTGCSAATATPAPAVERATVQPASVQPVRVGIYSTMSDADFAGVQSGLCRSFGAGYTVDDAVRVQADLFGAKAASEMRTVAQSIKDTGC
jgi:hypothetical protein